MFVIFTLQLELLFLLYIYRDKSVPYIWTLSVISTCKIDVANYNTDGGTLWGNKEKSEMAKHRRLKSHFPWYINTMYSRQWMFSIYKLYMLLSFN
jgi:hypothetical protein